MCVSDCFMCAHIWCVCVCERERVNSGVFYILCFEGYCMCVSLCMRVSMSVCMCLCVSGRILSPGCIEFSDGGRVMTILFMMSMCVCVSCRMCLFLGCFVADKRRPGWSNLLSTICLLS